MQPTETSHVETDKPSQNRPKLVWVVFIIGCGMPLGILIEFLTRDSLINMGGVAGQYYQNMPTSYYVLGVFFGLYFFFSSLQLFRLKGNASILFALMVPLAILDNFFGYGPTTNREAIQSQSELILSLTVGPAIIVLLCWYVFRLKAKGILTP